MRLGALEIIKHSTWWTTVARCLIKHRPTRVHRSAEEGRLRLLANNRALVTLYVSPSYQKPDGRLRRLKLAVQELARRALLASVDATERPYQGWRRWVDMLGVRDHSPPSRAAEPLGPGTTQAGQRTSLVLQLVAAHRSRRPTRGPLASLERCSGSTPAPTVSTWLRDQADPAMKPSSSAAGPFTHCSRSGRRHPRLWLPRHRRHCGLNCVASQHPVS
jgi:hypothetical protein